MQPSDQIPPVGPSSAGTPAGKSDPGSGLPSQDSRTMGMLAHLLGAVTGFLGPLIIWLVKKDTDAFVDDQGKEALNFQITIVIAMFVSIALAFVSCGFLFFLPLVPAICGLVFAILGAVEANKGVAYRYPICIRLIK